MSDDAPLMIDLFCGLGGGTEGAMAEGYDCIGFDIERHVYGSERYPAQLVLQNALTIHGKQFRDAAYIWASPPCQEFSYMAMPWKRGKQIAAALREFPEGKCVCPEKCDCQDFDKGLVSNLCPEHNCRADADEQCTALEHVNGAAGRESKFPEGYTGSRTIAQLTAIFDACFRIQREACEAAGRYIPMVVENVKGAQPWVGKAKAHFGSFYLWGDVAMVGNRVVSSVPTFGQWTRPMRAQKFNPDGTDHPQGSWFKIADSKERGARKIAEYSDPRRNGGKGVHMTSPRENDSGVKQPGHSGRAWFADPDVAGHFSSKSDSRKAASAQIAKIPFELSRYIARAYKPLQAPSDLSHLDRSGVAVA